MSNTVKVGDNLQEIVSKLIEAQTNVSEALVIYASVFQELSSTGYEGSASESLIAYYTFICTHLQSLTELYGKIATYINYVYEEMKRFDEELAALIGAGFSGLKVGRGI